VRYTLYLAFSASPDTRSDTWLSTDVERCVHNSHRHRSEAVSPFRGACGSERGYGREQGVEEVWRGSALWISLWTLCTIVREGFIGGQVVLRFRDGVRRG
jgi:hypothetical protein